MSGFLWDGQGMDYGTGYSKNIMKILALGGGMILLIAFMMHIIIYFVNRRLQIKISEQRENPPGPSKCQLVLEIVSDCLFWLGYFIINLNFSILSGFDYISTPSAICTQIIAYALALVYQLYRCSIYCNVKQSQLIPIARPITTRLFEIITVYKYTVMGGSIVLLFCAIFFPLFFEKSCLCFNTHGYGLRFSSISFSSQMTRAQELPTNVCSPYKICHVYATLPATTWNSVIINVHTGTQLKHIEMVMSNTNFNLTFVCQQGPFPAEIEDRGQRNVFTCLATGLQSSTLYDVSIMYQGQPLRQTSYRTLPNSTDVLQNNFTILFGGDFAYEPIGIELIKKMALQDPDIVLIGGDIAYDDAMNTCYYSWDLMLQTYEQAFLPLGRLVPMILAVGNHDVGLNSMANANITVTNENGPLYFTYFPQEFDDEQQTKLKEVKHRKTYVHHFLGNFILLSLDSGYLYGFEDQQTQWIDKTLSLYAPTYYPLAQYHNPLYPVCFTNGSTKASDEQLKLSKQIWLPLFENYKVLAAFENHVHHYKRTHPIKNGVPNENGEGVMFFGDGCLGVWHSECPILYQTNVTFNQGIFAAVQYVNGDHFWIMRELPNGTITYIALDQDSQPMVNSSYQMELRKRDL